MNRTTQLLATYFAATALATPALAQSPVRQPVRRPSEHSTAAPAAPRLATLTGEITRSRYAGPRDAQFALWNEQGKLAAYLRSDSTVELDTWVDRTATVTVRQPGGRAGRAPVYLVERIEPLPGATNFRSAIATTTDNHVLPAIFAAPERDVCTQWPYELSADCAVGDCAVGCPHAESCSAPVVCKQHPRIWGEADYLMFWTQGMDIPPLVTTSPAATPRDQAGVLGESTTTILLGNDDLLDDLRSGLRVRLGVWFDDSGRLGLQGEYWGLEKEAESVTFASDATGLPILARPFFNINPRDPFTLLFDPPAREDAELISFPAVSRGDVTVSASTELHAVGLLLRHNAAANAWGGDGAGFSRIDLLAGYRFLNHRDRLQIVENVVSLDIANPGEFNLVDRFGTKNEFHGGDVGLQWETGTQRWSANLLVRSAFGNTRQTAAIDGSTVITVPSTAPASYSGGLLAQDSNIGRYERDEFTIVPEVGVTLGLNVSRHWRLTAGYTLLYWTSVARAGDQIDLDVNPDQLAPPITPIEGALRPEFEFRDDGMWVQGLSVGLQGSW